MILRCRLPLAVDFVTIGRLGPIQERTKRDVLPLSPGDLISSGGVDHNGEGIAEPARDGPVW